MKATQIIIFIFFGSFIILGVLVFGGFIPSPNSKSQASKPAESVVIWGTLPGASISGLVAAHNGTYEEHSVNTFANDLVEAMASGVGPDLVIFPDNLLLRLVTKIEPFPVQAYNERTFHDTFIDEGQLFIGPQGILALPLALDPLVMYWNKDMFFTENIANPPRYWDEFLPLSQTLTKRNDANDVLKSVVALGEWSNVNHAKDILALLILQTGNPMTQRQQDGSIISTFSEDKRFPPADEAIRFFTDFADPLKSNYSWNRSLPRSKNAFLSQDLAVYFGYASELSDIRSKNPNLNFDVASVPQVRNYQFKKTFGRMIGIAVMKSSTKKPAAFSTAILLASFDFGSAAPVKRASLASVPTNDLYAKVFSDGALTSASWLDPNPEKTDQIFQSAIESVASGKYSLDGAVRLMNSEVGLLLLPPR